MSRNRRLEFDPPGTSERVRTWIEQARVAHPDLVVELFLRISDRQRVSRTASSESRAKIREEGLAVRVASEGGGRVGFAATTSLDDRSIAETIDRASTVTAGTATPITTDAREQEDHRGSIVRPNLEDLAARHLQQLDALPGADTVLESILEHGVVEETIATTAGLHVQRSRARSWWYLDLAYAAGRRARFEPGSPDGALPDVDAVAPWAATLATLEPGTSASVVPEGLPWRLSPPAAGVLVRALVQSLPVLDEAADGIPVGPAWRVADEPQSPAALFGGRFDDTGRLTGRTVLGDGRLARTNREASGRAWRPSFRDPPELRAAHPVVEGGPEAAGGPFLDLLDLKLTPVTGRRWHLEGLSRRPDGASVIVTDVVNPEDLLRRFAATAGPGRATADGVWTPAVVLAP